MTNLNQGQHSLHQQAVIGVAPEAQHGHTILWLVQEGQGGVINQDCPAEQTDQGPGCIGTRLVQKTFIKPAGKP
mgnify:FL=1